MIVVSSLSTSTAWPARSSSVAFSSDIPTSSAIRWPPVSTAMSSSIALRRSPKPGAFTAQAFSTPRSEFTTSAASASPSTSSATTSSGRLALATCSSSGQQVVDRADLAVADQHVRFLEHHPLLSATLMKYGDR